MLNINYSLKSLKIIVEKVKPSKIVLVSSNNLIPKLNWAITELKELTPVEIKIIQVPDGEVAKEWGVLKELLSDFIEVGLNRKSIVIAFGGGSITDLVGFASSIYQRGVPYINIPTTLLAQIDSSIGGKTAINFLDYKNQIGSFYNPIAIIIGSRFLETLTERQIIDGFAEIIKYGLIKDPSILEIIKSRNLAALREESVMEGLISKSIKVKEYFIEKDPYDLNIRQILNFGHTIAHSLELKYNLSHGEAVLIGMMEELKLGEQLGVASPEIKNYLGVLLKNLNITLNKKQLKVDWKSILHDKKISGKEINLPVVKKLGEAKLIKVRLDKLISLIK
ncbi:MAG TPA: 3-dehydroquinate synthase [Candidatus Wolfebacteria bacterium]|nr:3-dehydroquinate synthase [Candidatus Wolfebacteria bacterium]